jgi:GntR family transcriptional repressor for pyruvate dehydrogenase complex
MGLVRIEPRSGAYVQEASFASSVSLLADTLETALTHEDSSIFDVIAARRMLEVEIVGEAAARSRPKDLLPIYEMLKTLNTLRDDRPAFIEADERFHLGLAEVAGNKVLLTLLRAIMILLRPFRSQLEADAEKWSRIEQGHMKIYNSILDGNGEAAREAMREHLSDDRERALAMMRKLQ